MAKHLVFLDSYTDTLKKNLQAGDASLYLQPDSFTVDNDNVIEINTPVPEVRGSLCEEMIATITTKDTRHNFEAARLLYEAYMDLPLVIAASESFWAYLCHTNFYRFVQKDWSLDDKLNNSKASDYIVDHYFFGPHGKMRNALASLWWSIKLTIDENRDEEHKYDLSKVMFKNYSLRTTWLSVVYRIQSALHGILEFLLEHPEISKEKEEARYRFISNYVNRLGSTKNLSAMSKDYIKDQLSSVYDKIIEAKIPGKTMTADSEIGYGEEYVEHPDVELDDNLER